MNIKLHTTIPGSSSPSNFGSDEASLLKFLTKFSSGAVLPTSLIEVAHKLEFIGYEQEHRPSCIHTETRHVFLNKI
jgi:hypothetical protein